METIGQIWSMLLGENDELRGIIAVTLRMAVTSTIISASIGIPLGAFLGMSSFAGKRLVTRVVHTFMGFPPVVSGLVVFFLLSATGPFGRYRMLYSVTAMVTAQILLITPVALGLSSSIVGARWPLMRETADGIGMCRWRQLFYGIYECRKSLFSVLFLCFGRAISEVGSAQLVGGNVQYKTRVMTTAIVLETNMGNFELAIALGVLLMLISLVVTSAAQFFQEGRND